MRRSQDMESVRLYFGKKLVDFEQQYAELDQEERKFSMEERNGVLSILETPSQYFKWTIVHFIPYVE